MEVAILYHKIGTLSLIFCLLFSNTKLNNKIESASIHYALHLARKRSNDGAGDIVIICH